jgi:hypothetical protein
MRAARQLWGERPADDLERLAQDLAQRLALPMAVVEDALCNWQKKVKFREGSAPPAFMPLRELRRLSEGQPGGPPAPPDSAPLN